VLGSAITRANVAYVDPKSEGGSMLTIVNGTYPAGLGEPLNVILSAESDSAVLVPSLFDGGYLNYMLSTFLANECLGAHMGSDQLANLGDGRGNVTQAAELRWDFGDPYIGSCQETFDGGLHLRYWVQNTTGAYFMAVSVEKSLNEGHDIVVNGYDRGRDDLVGNVTGSHVMSGNVTNQTSLSGQSSFGNYTYQTDVQYVSGLLQNSSDGINHYLTVEANGQPAIDGLVAVLTVKIVSRPASSGALSTIRRLSSVLVSLPILIAIWTLV